MSLTTPTVHVPDTRVSVPAWVRRHLAWMLVAVAVFATAVFITLTVVGSDSGTDTAPHSGIIERGSITAIDHRSAPAPAAGSVLDQSITARDRAASNGSR